MLGSRLVFCQSADEFAKNVIEISVDPLIHGCQLKLKFYTSGLGHVTTNLTAVPESGEMSCSSNDNQTNQSFSSQPVENPSVSNSSIEKKLDSLAMIEGLQIIFLRLLQRLGLSQDNLMVAKVLYRIHLATLVRAGESDLKRANLRIDRARALAAEQEAAGIPELDFVLRILVFG